MWANVVAHYMYYLATFSVRDSRNYLTYEISTDSDRKSVVLATGLSEEFPKRYPLFDQFFSSFQIPDFEKEDLENLLGEDIYNKVKGNSEFQEKIMKLGGNLNYIKSFASCY